MATNDYSNLGKKQSVSFPPLPEGEVSQIENMLKTMGEFMDIELDVSEVRSISVTFDAGRNDVAQILSRIARAKRQQLGLIKPKKGGTA